MTNNYDQAQDLDARQPAMPRASSLGEAAEIRSRLTASLRTSVEEAENLATSTATSATSSACACPGGNQEVKATRTDLLRPDTLKSETEKLWIYNGLDCCVTLEVLEALLPQTDNLTGGTYALSRALQGPVLYMNMRGVRIDELERQRAIAAYRSDVEQLEEQLRLIVHDGVGHTEFKNLEKLKHGDPTTWSQLFSMMSLNCLKSARETPEETSPAPSIARPSRNSTATLSLVQLLAISSHLETTERSLAFLRQRLTPTAASGRAITSQALRQADSQVVLTISELAEISRILRRDFAAYLSPTPE